MRINNNLMAMNTHRQLGSAQGMGAKSMEKLSSGLRINRAGDDAAGLSISEKMRGQIRGLNQASRNAQDGISLIQTAEGALNETHSILQRMRELAVQSANDTNVEVDRDALQAEIDELSAEITRIADTTEFNTQNLLGGGFEGTFQIGANTGQNIGLSINEMSASALGVVQMSFADAENFGDVLTVTNLTAHEDVTIEIVQSAEEADFGVSVDGNAITVTLGADSDDEPIEATWAQVKSAIEGNAQASQLVSIGVREDADLTGTAEAVNEATLQNVTEVADATKGIQINSQEDADRAITIINNALETVSAERSKLGAFQNRLEHTINNLDTSAENLQAAESRIRDVDMAKEMMEFTKNNILQQASQAMLAQANAAPQSVLQLLG